MTATRIEREVESLRESLDNWNHQYYVLDQPSIPLRLRGQGFPDVLEVRREIYLPRCWNACKVGG